MTEGEMAYMALVLTAFFTFMATVLWLSTGSRATRPTAQRQASSELLRHPRGNSAAAGA